ncbi:unnamed protein product [Colletotrichum noveboracense]|uniref:Methyltransferase domain-containing protein n=1 Tax=Colletotrichum noveboracense TaxID=2664923 RepID=A0A9W4WBN1_9PEZI|nr:unnamed protein product [Colletotrichum noveboracense]
MTDSTSDAPAAPATTAARTSQTPPPASPQATTSPKTQTPPEATRDSTASPTQTSPGPSAAPATPATRAGPVARTVPPEIDLETAGEPGPIEPNDVASATDDDGLTIDDRLSTYTESLTSSVIDYPEEFGRRYHAYRPGSYNFPNDEGESDRLDLFHSMVVKTIGYRLFLAPVDPGRTHRILDVGTGTGIWAIEAAELFPDAEIYGNDLSAIQPGWVPPNVRFEIDDVESTWMDDRSYDFIHSRYMACSLKDWPTYIRRVYDALNPNGWAEFSDMSVLYGCDDGTLKEEHALMKWDRLFMEACDKLGTEHSPGPKLDAWVRQQPYRNVRSYHFKIPLGPWAKDPHNQDLGWNNLAQTIDGLDAFTLKLFIGVLGWTREEVIVLLAQVRKELKSRPFAFHAHIDWYVVYGQKVVAEKN